jgi:TldD protein
LKTVSFALGTLALPSWVYSADLTNTHLPEVDKNKLADTALSLAKKSGAEYADIRINRYRLEMIATRAKQVLNVSRGQNFGFGVRVLAKGT